jgi:hypothetical protein
MKYARATLSKQNRAPVPDYESLDDFRRQYGEQRILVAAGAVIGPTQILKKACASGERLGQPAPQIISG